MPMFENRLQEGESASIKMIDAIEIMLAWTRVQTAKLLSDLMLVLF